MKNILFISRDFLHKGNSKQAELYQQEHINIINNSWMNTGNGFFYNALKTIGKLSISFGIMNTVNLLKKSRFDLLVFELKFFIYCKPSEKFIKLIKALDYPVILLLGYDGNFSKIISLGKLDEIFKFNSIYIPNLYKNVQKYNLPEYLTNKLKITHYGLGNQDLVYNIEDNKIENVVFPHLIEKKYDLFFAGSTSEDKFLRNSFLNDVNKDSRIKEFKTSIEVFPSSYKVQNIDKEEFVKRMKQSNASLDLSGSQDNITMRFNEILLNNELPLVDKGFKNYWVSTYYEKFINLICFENLNHFFDLLKKYQNDEFRKLYTTELKKVWANYYDPKKHGEEIRENLGW